MPTGVWIALGFFGVRWGTGFMMAFDLIATASK